MRFLGLLSAVLAAMVVFDSAALAQSEGARLARRPILILDSDRPQLPRLVMELGARSVALSEVGPIELESEITVVRDRRGERNYTPSQAGLKPIVLTRIVDGDRSLAEWAETVAVPSGALDSDDYQKDVLISRLNTDFEPEQAWALEGCIPITYAMSEGMINAGPPPTERLTIQCEKARRRL
ncbi:MAG: phage tail protein [Pseudomonadota bacterium]